MKPISIMDGEPLESENRDVEDIYDLNANKEKEINSGTKIRVPIGKCGCFWLYKPYNYEIQKRSNQLIHALKRYCILEENLRDIDFIVNDIDKIRGVYKDSEVDGDINENSMVVCSMPSGNNWQLKHIYFKDNNLMWDSYMLWGSYMLRPFIVSRRHVGCIYTGDASLAKIKRDFFRRFRNLNSIGTVQVAHHGSYKNFDINFFKRINGYLTCPISFGSGNNYGHPSDRVLADLLCNENFPVCINEIRGGSFVQVFSFDG